MKARYGLIFLGMACAGSLEAGKRLSDSEIWVANIGRPFSSVSAADGIDELEANFLAYWYFMKHGGLCGFASPVEKKGDWWTAETVVGFPGTASGLIKIHRRQGIIFWRNNGKWLAPPWADLHETLKMGGGNPD